MRSALLLAAVLAGRADDAGAVAARVSETQSRLPWFWSASMEGVVDIPYRYEVDTKRRIEDARGKEIKASKRGSPLAEWRTVRLEVIPLEFGTEQKCLVRDGVAGCGPEWTEAMRAAIGRRDAMDEARKAEVRAKWSERRTRWKAEWRAFVAEHRFEDAGPGVLRFTGPKQGELRFDPAMHEVTSMSYRAGGEEFAVELTRAVDGRMLPARVRWRGPRNGRVEERTSVYSGYQRFEGSSSVRFEER